MGSRVHREFLRSSGTLRWSGTRKHSLSGAKAISAEDKVNKVKKRGTNGEGKVHGTWQHAGPRWSTRLGLLSLRSSHNIPRPLFDGYRAEFEICTSLFDQI